MIAALIAGTLARDPQSGVSAKGRAWTRCTLRVDEQGAAHFFALLVFDAEHAEALLALRKGDPCAATGRLEIGEYQTEGGERRQSFTLIGAKLLALDAPAPKRARKPKPAAEAAPVDPFADLEGCGDLGSIR